MHKGWKLRRIREVVVRGSPTTAIADCGHLVIPATKAGHPRCGERLKCPCWLDGAREEGEMHRTRVTTRELTDYIRALGDNDPAMTLVEVADAVYRVYGSSDD